MLVMSSPPAPTAFPLDRNALPTLYRDRSFWGITITQFFGAFNDNLFKQLLLLLAVPIGVASLGCRWTPLAAKSDCTLTAHRKV